MPFALATPPTDLPTLCNGCGEPFTVSNVVVYKKGGQVHQCHDVYNGEFGYFCEACLTLSAVRSESIINNGCVLRSEGV